MRIVVLGANGRLGREVVRQADERGHEVTAFVRRVPSSAFATAVRVRIGDALQMADVRAALSGQEVVVNAIGAGTLRRNEIESRTTAIAVDAAQEVGVSRYVAMSAGMVALDWPLFRYVLLPTIFRNLAREHHRVERLVRASLLDWTIVRPSRLTDGPARGYTVSLERPGSFSVSRHDVAAFILDEIATAGHVHRAVFIGAHRR